MLVSSGVLAAVGRELRPWTVGEVACLLHDGFPVLSLHGAHGSSHCCDVVLGDWLPVLEVLLLGCEEGEAGLQLGI